MTQTLISIIVPVYNTEQYLSQCIESLIAQTYEHIEIVLVDDGATDKSSQIIEDYAKADCRIKAFHISNQGLSVARNYGMKRAHGDYYVFVDSDDFVSEHYVQHLFDLVKKTRCLMGITSLVTFREDGEADPDSKDIFCDSSNVSPRILSAKNAIEDMLYMRQIDSAAYAKIYKRELFDDIQYPPGKIFEDIATTALLIDKAKKVAFLNNKDYCYRIRTNSIQTADFSPKVLDLLEQLDIIKCLIEKKYIDIMPAYLSKLQSALFNLYMKIPVKKNRYNDIARELWSEIKLNRCSVIFDNKARKDARIASILSYLGPSICRVIYRMVR